MGKWNEVAEALSRKREAYPDLQTAFVKRKPCELGKCPDCLFHEITTMQRHRSR
jgi:hypothetical protein